jgi:hypothetical protein
LTQYSFDKKKAGQREVSGGNREKYGFKNPPKDSGVGLQILSKGVRPDSKKPIELGSATFHKKRARYDTKNPAHSKKNFPFSDAILGHKEDASAYWNKTGHKKTKAENQAWNKDPKHYWGPEHFIESAASGSKAERYKVPSKAAGSHKSWW